MTQLYKMPLDTNDPQKNAGATLRIPFDSIRHAEIAYRVLNVDQEPRRNFVKKQVILIDDSIEVQFTADQVKNIRTAITCFFESLLLCKDTITAFDLDTESTDAGTHSGPNTA